MCSMYMELNLVFKLSLKIFEFEKKNVKTKSIGSKIWKIRLEPTLEPIKITFNVKTKVEVSL
jgi:hypothetical protein